MKTSEIRKIAIFDQGHPVYDQLLTKAQELFGGGETEFIRITAMREDGRQGSPEEGRGAWDPAASPEAAAVRPDLNHMKVIGSLEQALRREDPDLVLIGATALGEEIAPALGVRLRTGVAAHCIEIRETGEGELAFLVPAFGGKVVGEILIPRTRPMIATVKPGIFTAADGSAAIPAQREDRLPVRTVFADPEAADEAGCRGLRLTGILPKQTRGAALDKAKILVCGGFGIGSADNWQKIEMLADRLGGAAGCTRPVVDMGWGPEEDQMIGTSGRTVRPGLYLGFGISGAAHHLCGIRDAGTIISINSDRDAEVFRASDHIGVFDAGRMLDLLLQKLD